MVEQFADGLGDGLRRILHQQAVLAMADDLRQPAHVARHHRHARRHGQQRARAQAFAVRDVDEDRGVAEVALQIGGELQLDARQAGGFEGQRQRPCADRPAFAGATTIVPRAGSSSGTPSYTTLIFSSGTPPATRTDFTNSDTAR